MTPQRTARAHTPYGVLRPLFLAGNLLLPLFAFAEEITVYDLIGRIGDYVVNPLIFLMFSVAFLVFIWGLVQFVMNLDNEEARSTGIKHMIWGIIGMVIMLGVNGIKTIIQNTVNTIGGV